MRRAIDFAVLGIFSISAALQLNDPDPVLWIIAYGLVAVAALNAVLGRRNHPAMLGLAALVCVFELAASTAGFLQYVNSGDLASLTGAMHPDRPYVEEAREFLGMLIALMTLGWYAVRWGEALKA